MKKNIKTIQFLSLMVIMAFLVLPLSLNGQGSKANFSGTWTLNAEKSTPAPTGGGGGGRMGGGNFVATQNGNNLSVERSFTRDGETTKRTTEYTLDGKEKVTEGNRPSKSTATWSADGKSLTIKTTSTFNSNTFTSTEVWSSTSPTSLTIKRTQPGRDGGAERITTQVYDKK